jgi:hypothetical protein
MSDRPLSRIRQLVALCMLVAAVVTIGHRRRTERGPIASASARITEVTRGNRRSATRAQIQQTQEQVRAGALPRHGGIAGWLAEQFMKSQMGFSQPES